MTTKIAPTLVYAHKPVPPREIAQGRGIGVRSYHAASAWRELRALLDVARAAQRLITTARMLPARAALIEIKPDSDDLDHALLRLANVSGSSRGSRQGGR